MAAAIGGASRARRGASPAEGSAAHPQEAGAADPGAVTATVRAAIQGVDDAIASGDVERLNKANVTLDEAMDDHLSFARKSTLREYAESIGVAIAVALLLRAFVVEAFQIPSGSMIPTLEVGDHIFVSKFSYGLSIPFTDTKIMQYGEPERGDVDRVQVAGGHQHRLHQARRRPARGHRRGAPGAAVRERQARFTASASRCAATTARVSTRRRRRTTTTASTGSRRWEQGPRQILEPAAPGRDHPRPVVPAGEVFVMGDNRDNSYDSRKWGTVKMNLIKGRALIIWWSRGNSKPWDLVAWVQAIRWRRFFSVVH